MWIKINSATRAFTPPEADEEVQFNDNGKAQVSKSLGKKLVENYDSIEASKGEKSKKTMKPKKKKKKTKNEVKDSG